jgi:hypothetical protein
MALAFVRTALEKVRSKYHAQGLHDRGDWFASQREHTRWRQLEILRDAGHITGLARQVRFTLTVIGLDDKPQKIGVYIADAVYRECPHGRGWPSGPLVVEDAKGVRTELYRWKRRHFEVQYGIVIREV